jgi:uncharacterized protein YneF (UPF0154 family)
MKTMNTKILVAISLLITLAFVVTTAVAAYANNMMTQQQGIDHSAMSEEQCETMMNGMHSSDHHNSMMGGSMMGTFDHDSMMDSHMGENSTDTMGSNGCH